MHGVREKNKQLKERRRLTATKKREGFLLEANIDGKSKGSTSNMPAGRAASAAKALLKLQELEKENDNLKRLRKVRKEEVVKKEPENLTRETIHNYRKDKELMEEAVKRKLARDKEDAERAKTEPPPDFVARVAKKAQEEAQTAAFSKGKSAREAMALGKAAYQGIQEKYRKQGLTAEQRDEEAEEEDRIMLEKLREEERIRKVHMMATDTIAGARLGIEEKEGDLTATKAWKDFNQEVKKWEMTGGRNEVADVREAMAEFLTEKYMCQKLDALPRTIVVTKIRKDMMGIIENFVAPQEGDEKAGDRPGVPFDGDQGNNDSDDEEDESDDDDDYDYMASKNKNVKLRMLMAQKKRMQKEQEQAGGTFLSTDAEMKKMALDNARRRQSDIQNKKLSSIEERQKMDYDKDIEDHKFDWDRCQQKRNRKKDRGARKTFVSFEPWKCSLCGKENEAKERNCKTCGRDKTFKTAKAKEQAVKDKETYKTPKDEKEMDEWKQEADKHKKINEDYLRFIAMKTKTDESAKERDDLAGDIQGLLKSLRGSLGPLSDEVVAPEKVTERDWRVKESNGRTDGKHVNELNLDTDIEVDVARKQKREDYLRSIGAGTDFAPQEGPNTRYSMSDKEKAYHDKKKPFDYDRIKKG